MNSKLAALLKTYNDLPDVHRQIIDCLSIKFSGTDKSGGLRYLQTLINPKILIKIYDLYLKELVLQRIVTFIDNRYDLPSELKFELFPKLIQQKKYIEFIEEEQSIDKYYSWNSPFTENLRDFLFASFVAENEYTKKATTYLLGNLSKAIPYFYLMLGHLKQDHRLSRNFMLDAIGDKVNTLLAAAGFNLRKMLQRLKAEALQIFAHFYILIFVVKRRPSFVL